ncbi:MAG: hypothetical protein ACYC2K_08325 [Gemmatimonadales bacterium]
MVLLGLIVLAALMIPIIVVLVDSPIGRAVARRLEGPVANPPQLDHLAKRVEILEAEVGELDRSVESLREENRFLQRLLEAPRSPTLPPPDDT